MKPIFVKYSNERKTKFQIKTIIKEDIFSSEKSVIKEALFTEGKEHIQKIKENYELLIKYNKSEKIRFIPYKKVSELAIEFPYISGEKLSDLIVSFIKSGHYLQAEQYLIDYFEEIKKTSNIVPFQTCEAFQAVLGNSVDIENEDALEISNLDVILDNIIIMNGFYEVIDYEWVFNFPVPLGFLGYRILNSIPYFEEMPQEYKSNLYRIFKIKTNHIPAYKKMDRMFQEYVTGNYLKLDELYAEMDISNTEMRLIEEKQSYCKREIFAMDLEGKIMDHLKERVLPTNGNVVYALDDYVVNVRINLTDKSCILRLDGIIAECKDGIKRKVNDFKMFPDYKSDNLYYYSKKPVQLLIESKDYKIIEVRYAILFYDNPLIESIIALLREKENIVHMVESKNKEILLLGDRLSDLKREYDEKNGELITHVQLLDEIRSELLAKHDECQEILKIYNEIQEKKDDLQKHLDYILGTNTFRALKYIGELKKRKCR